MILEKIMKNIENYKKNTITLDEIQNFYKINEYDMLYKTVNDLINNEKLCPVKASGGNGRTPGMYKKYKIIRKEEVILMKLILNCVLNLMCHIIRNT